MRIPYGFELISDGTLEVNKDEARSRQDLCAKLFAGSG